MRMAYADSLVCRSMIGVDRRADLIETAMRRDCDHSDPPYDIEKTADDAYRLSLAVAGLRPTDLELRAEPNLLMVAGRHDDPADAGAYLHRGIATGSFERRFELADDMVVKAAQLRDGVLLIELARDAPEALNPRPIEIRATPTSGEVKTIRSRQAERQAD